MKEVSANQPTSIFTTGIRVDHDSFDLGPRKFNAGGHRQLQHEPSDVSGDRRRGVAVAMGIDLSSARRA